MRFCDAKIIKPCGGNGTCKKCAVKFIGDAPFPTKADRRSFTKEELLNGYRLACQVDAMCEFEIEEISKLEDIGSVIDFNFSANSMIAKNSNESNETSKYAMCIDIGTTTIAFVAISLLDGKVLSRHMITNPGRIYGADVLSRIKVSTEGKAQEITESLRCVILDEISDINNELTEFGLNASSKNTYVYVAGNTTMSLMLLGEDVEPLSHYPFMPPDMGFVDFELDDYSLKVFPFISGFVGGDIVSGIYALSMYNNSSNEDSKPSLLLDFGTNGEMALAVNGILYVTSTAAGPAFEGAGIECGVPSVPGAICSAKTVGTRLISETIGGSSAIGICGSGVISIIRSLLDLHLIDDNGTFIDDAYIEEGYFISKHADGSSDIRLFQDDIRAIQTAKSAIRSGIELLLAEAGLRSDDIHTVYLSGGMGTNLSVDDVIAIGLIPSEFEGKVTSVGNSSMGGLVKFAMESDYGLDSEMKDILSFTHSARVIDLANHEQFNDSYIEYMNFRR